MQIILQTNVEDILVLMDTEDHKDFMTVEFTLQHIAAHTMVDVNPSYIARKQFHFRHSH